MSENLSASAGRAVFLSYASQDAEAARRIGEALRSGGVEVWFDQEGGLEHGDEWDAKIRRQIKECVLFIPLISANTQAREEGYFRVEWDLAAERAHGIASGVPFILPIVIDNTREADALVPDRFLKVHWTRLPGGDVRPEVQARFLSLWSQRTGASPHETTRVVADQLRTGRPKGLLFRPRHAAAVAAVVLAVTLAALWVAKQPGWLRFSDPEGTTHLVVLPFQNIGETPGNQAFSEGLSETITSQLTQLERFQRRLLVVPMSEVRKESVVTGRDARAVFGASRVLSGSVQREERNLRVIVSLIDTHSLRILRSATLDSPPTETYRLQDRVAAEAVGWLGLELSQDARRALSAGQTSVPSAHPLYVSGRGELARHEIPGNLDAAVVHLQQALVKDPRFALAHAALGDAFWLKYKETEDGRWVEEAQRSCQAALEFARSLAEPHVTLATILDGTSQYEQAAAEAATALRLDPANAEATRVLARSYQGLNRLAEAEAAFQRAIDRNPDNALAYSDLAVFYYRTGRHAEAEKQFLRVTELTPDSPTVYRNLGGLYIETGRPDEAAAWLQKSIALRPTARAYSNLGTLRFQQERYADSARLFELAVSLSPRDHRLLGNLADALRFIPGRAAEATAIYQRAIQRADEALLVKPNDAAVRASIALFCAFSGDTARALDEIGRARTLAPEDVPIMGNAALVFERAGERGRALDVLGRAIKRGYPRAEINRKPDLKELRADPRFTILISESARP